MITRHGAAFLVVAAAALPLSCIGADRSPNIRLTIPPGVTVPKIDQLRARLEDVLRQPSGTKVYAREGDRWVEVKPPPLAQGLSAVVRSYNEKEGAAHVELAYPQYKMPMLQIWRFDGRKWSDTIDPGIFVR